MVGYRVVMSNDANPDANASPNAAPTAEPAAASAAASSSPPVRPYRIVAGVAFDDTGVHALSEAARVAARVPGAEIHAVYVMSDESHKGTSGKAINDAGTELEEAPDLLNKFTAKHIVAVGRRVPTYDVHAHVRVGVVAAEIMQLAVDLDADLVVVGTHNRRGLARLMLGSVAQDLVAAARCPVLIAHPKDFEGLATTPGLAPTCEACARVRVETNNEKFWCPEHDRPHVATHIYGYGDSTGMPSHPASIIPPGFGR